MQLRALVSASVQDPDTDDLSYVYAYDQDRKYCVSLSRYPDSNLIEVMVRDQLNVKTLDLMATLTSHTLVVELGPTVAAKLDGHARYEIELLNSEDTMPQLRVALEAVFADHRGLYLRASQSEINLVQAQRDFDELAAKLNGGTQ